MKQKNRLVTIKGKYLARFIEEVSRLKPEARIDASWLKLNRDDREVRIASFLAMQGFTEEELRKIKGRVFRIKLPLKEILIVTVILLLSFTGYKYYKFLASPRIYAIGNDIPVFEAADSAGSKIVYRLNIYGQSISGSKHSGTRSSMLLVKDMGDAYMVKDANFFNWLFGKEKELYVNKNGVVANGTEYKGYKRIFQEVKGTLFLTSLNVTDRRAIYSYIGSNNDFFNAVVSNNFSQDDLEDFKPFVTANGDNERYIFLCLKTQSGRFSNMKITIKSSMVLNSKTINFLSKTFDSPLMFKDYFLNPQQQNPIIMYREKPAETTYQCVAPPYDPDNFTKK